MARKRSFLQRLTGSSSDEQSYDYYEEPQRLRVSNDITEDTDAFDAEEGQLSVDVYEFDGVLYIRTITAGVRKSDIEISLTRETLTIRGSRYMEHNPDENSFFYRELFWGSFSRTIHLPEEVDIEQAKATEEHGLLTIALPKIDKYRSTKINVK